MKTQANRTSAVPPSSPTKEHLLLNDMALAWASKSVDIREKIFEKIDEIVELQFQLILPTLDHVRKLAPTEIMRRLVRTSDIKAAFPSVVDTMFQWEVDQERKAKAETKGLFILLFTTVN